jgi:type VI secretion system secreted protein VgrG
MAALCALGVLLLCVSGASAAATSVSLGTANSFAVLAGAGITNTGPTTVTGDIGTFPTTSESGVGSVTINGTDHGGDAVTQGAKSDLVTAYNTAAGEGPTNPITADLGGQTLTAGVYNSASSIGLTGTLTLDGGGDPNAVFVFQAGSSLTTASASHISLTNDAQSCNVFWQVGSSATLGTGSKFVGTVIALTDITVTTGVTVDGRVLARNGAVTLDTDTISRSDCARPPEDTTTTTTAAPAATTTTAAATTTTTAAATTTTPITTAAVVKTATAKKAVATNAAAATAVAKKAAKKTAVVNAATVKKATVKKAAVKKATVAKKVVAKKAVAKKAVVAKASAAAAKAAGHAKPSVAPAGFTG